MTSPYNEYHSMSWLNLEREERRLDKLEEYGHDCARHGRRWQCRRCQLRVAMESKSRREVKRHWRAKGFPEGVCKTMAKMADLKFEVEKKNVRTRS